MNRRHLIVAAVTAPLALAGIYLFAGVSFSPQQQPVGYVGRAALTSSVVSPTRASSAIWGYYRLSNWEGDVRSAPIDGTTGNINTSAYNWTAAGRLATQHYDTARIIATSNGASAGLPFRWDSLSSDQQSAIGDAITGPKILNYVRGDTSNENPNGAKFRARTSLYGAVVHSAPVYSPSSSGNTVFVGANDGMLHAINADTGNERWSFVPATVIPNLKNLVNAQPSATPYYVDGDIAVDIVNYGGNLKRVLVGSLGAGGKGIFALDVTNQSPVDESELADMVMWEISASSTGFSNLGYTYSTPIIRSLNYKVGDVPVQAAIFGNGYQNAGNGRAGLFVVNLHTGALIKEIVLTGDGGSVATPNGLSSVQGVDANRDGTVDYVYAGDLEGNLWKFDLSSESLSEWSASKLFTDSAGKSITVRPVVQSHPMGGFMVLFATGRMLLASDASDTGNHYVYGIWDGAPAANTLIREQTLTEKTYGAAELPVRSASNNVLCYSACPDPIPATTLHRGWRLALPAGERVLGNGTFYASGRFTFTSTNPTVSTSSLYLGKNWINQVNYLTGGPPGQVVFDLNGDGQVTSLDRLNNADGALDLTTDGIAVSRILDRDADAPGIQQGGFPSQPVVVSLPNLDKPIFVVGATPIDIPDPTEPPDEPPPPDDRGVSGGHFDVDIYYNFSTGSTTTTYNAVPPTATATVCAKAGDVSKAVGTLYVSCPTGSKLLTGFTDSKVSCGKGGVTTITLNCSNYTSTTTNDPSHGKKVHFHEYDDIFDVTGVNFLNASSTSLNLSNAVTSTATNFKVLVYNQYHSPAVKFKFGPSASYVPIRSYGNLTATHTDFAAMLSALPTHNRSNVGNFVFNLPLDAFKSKDWAGDGNPRAGLIPTQTGCVNKSLMSTPGKLGEPHNGAITWQVIKSDTPASAIQMNVTGRPDLGYRLKNSDVPTYLLAEYTVFWHHPNGYCYHEAGWTQSPPQDSTSDAKSQTPAPGSADPADGSFSGDDGGGGGGGGGGGDGGGGGGDGDGGGSGGGGDTGSTTVVTVVTVGDTTTTTTVTTGADGTIDQVFVETVTPTGVTTLKCTPINGALTMSPGPDGKWGTADDVNANCELTSDAAADGGLWSNRARGRQSWRDVD